MLLVIMSVQLFAVFQWSACHGFADNFHFSSLDLELRLIEGIHADQNTPLWMVRAFHNKLVGTAFDVFGAYLQFWNFSFLAGFISFTGILGVGAQFYYFFAGKKNLLLWTAFILVLLMPLVAVLNLIRSFPSDIRLVLISLPYLIWSMLGYRRMLHEKKIHKKIIVVVLLLSVWYLLALQSVLSICSLQ
jgi:hypothetical protein